MHRTTFLATTLTLLIGGGASLALAQDAGAPPPSPKAPVAGPDGSHGMRHGPQMPMRGGSGERGMRGGGFGVIGDLMELDRLYHEAGRSKELPALYNGVLAKSQDPRVRAFAYHQLARAQSEPTNLDTAIGTLRKSLDENLANEAKRRDVMEKMRAHWEQNRAAAPAPAGK